MRAGDDQLPFRAWLVKQLTLTRWSAPHDATDESMALHLGVHVDVLREAQALRESELKKRGKAGVVRGRRRFVGNDYAEINVKMPKSIDQDWREFCKTRRVERAMVFRSLVHHFLLDPKRPTTLSEKWFYRGEIVPWLWKEPERAAKTRITRGAQIAYDYHADRWDATSAALSRGLLVDFLEGKIPQVKMVAFSALWGDPDRYLHPEKFL